MNIGFRIISPNLLPISFAQLLFTTRKMGDKETSHKVVIHFNWVSTH